MIAFVHPSSDSQSTLLVACVNQRPLRHRVTLQSPTRIKLQARYSGGTRPRTLTNWTTPRPESKSISKPTIRRVSGCAEALNAVTPVLTKFTILLTSAISVLYKPSRVLFDLVPVSETDQHHRCRLHHGITLLNLSASAIAELANLLSPFDSAKDGSVPIMM
jgi:hypothetical protein